ncbi:MAG: efflux RND transporter permease subunit [Mariprofundales bacterium]
MNIKLNIAGKVGQLAMGSNITPIASLIIFIIGVFALLFTPREENPQIDVPAANILVQMQGASPEEVMNLVVRPLEQVVREITGVEHSYGMAADSLGVVSVQFAVGENKEESLIKLYDRIMHNLDRIPPGASQPLIKPLDVDDVPIFVATLSSTELDDLALLRLAERVRDLVAPTPGVSVVDIIGGQSRQISIVLDPDKLSAYGITLDALHNTLATANAGGKVGELVSDNHTARIWLAGYLQDADEVKRLVVGINAGKPVYVKDIASVHDGQAEIDNLHRIGFGAASADKLLNNVEANAISIMFAKQRGTNAVVVANDIRKKLTDLQNNIIPADVDITISRDSGDRANAAVNLLVEHLGIAIISIIILLLLFLGWREAAIVTLNIPLILFIVLAIGLLADQTINRITLFSLILALGLLVDDAIVVVENIHRHLQKGLHNGADAIKDKAALILRATNETGRPTIIATFAVILAFIPMAFVTGMMGPYMGPIPFNTPIAMLASLIIAYMFTPWLAQRWLPCHIKTQAIKNETLQINEPQDWLQRWYYKLARPLIEIASVRWLFFIITIALLLGALWQPAWQFVRPAGINGIATAGTVELKMLPKGNANTFNITIDMAEGTPLEQTDAVARAIANVLSDPKLMPHVTDYEVFIGQAGPIDFNAMLRGAGMKRGSNIAEIRVNLRDKLKRSDKSEQIVQELRNILVTVQQKYPTANIKLVEDPPGPPVRATLLAEIYGPDYPTLRRIASDVRQKFNSTYDVTDVDDSIGNDQVEYVVHINKEKAALQGVATTQVQQALVDFLAGFDLGAVHVDGERHPVNIHVRLPRTMRIYTEDLANIYVSGSNGAVRLSSIVEIKQRVAAKPMYSKDGHLVAYVSAETNLGSQVYPLLELDGKLDEQQIAEQTISTAGLGFLRVEPKDQQQYQVLWDGEMRLTLDVFRDLGAAFMVAILLIYILLVGYYGNFLTPMVVMAAIPLTMIGIFPGHLLTGQPFTATSMIGMIALAGIVVRNSLLLIDFIIEYRAEGHDLKDAVLEAGAIRARPILLTALAVIAGTSIMISDPVFGGLGVSMAFGALAATLLTLFVIPVLYYLFFKKESL